MRIKLAMWRFLAVVAVALAAMGMTAGSAQAQSANTTFLVTVNVPALCTISASTVDFGTYDPLSATDDDDGTGTVTVNCTPGTFYQVALDLGSSGTGARNLVSVVDPTQMLSYELYSDAPGGTVWGSTLGVDTVDNTFAAGPPVGLPVSARIFASQAITATGDYQDTVTATVNF